jgi:hypothetical protein
VEVTFKATSPRGYGAWFMLALLVPFALFITATQMVEAHHMSR